MKTAFGSKEFALCALMLPSSRRLRASRDCWGKGELGVVAPGAPLPPPTPLSGYSSLLAMRRPA
jgi:hypothetical protein